MFYPAAMKRVVRLATIFYERVAHGTRTPAGGAVIGLVHHVTPRSWWEIQEEETLLLSVYHANARQFCELSTSCTC